jgi:hypothetical protein
MARRQWTMKEIKEAKSRWEHGESYASIGRSYGVSGSTVRTLVVRYLGKPKRSPYLDKNPKHGALILEAIALKNTKGLSWRLVAERLNWPLTVQALRRAATRYVKTVGGNIEPGYGRRN